MKFFKKFGGLFFLILIIGLILILAKILVEKTKKNILNENKIEVILTPTIIIPKESVELVRIIDGDTIVVKINDKEESVRLIGIDAPETKKCFWGKATEKLKGLIENKKIRLEADESQNDKDKYDRLLRYIYLEDGTLVNEKLIETGFAKEYTYKIPYKFQTEFKNDQKIAEENNLGLWGECN